MFPWVCLATMPLFYPFDWPKRAKFFAEKAMSKLKGEFFKYTNKFNINTIYHKNHSVECVEEIEKHIDSVHNEEKSESSSDVDRIKEQNTNINNPFEKKINGEQICKQEEKSIDTKNKELDTKNNVTATPGEHTQRRKLTTFIFIVQHVLSQAFLPYSHFITKVRTL